MLALDPEAQISGQGEANEGVVKIPIGDPNPPAGFNSTLWTLLKAIDAAGVPLTGKVAEYAGFYNKVGASGTTTEWDATTDNGNNPDKNQTGTSQPNKSLDKLTFLIMFRLPFKKASANAFYGDPINGPTTSWSYKANQLRTGTLRKLNQAGEQVNASNQPCDDSGNPLSTGTSEYNTSTAFVYYENLGADLVNPVKPEVQALPLYYYLALTTEASFKPVPDDMTLSVAQLPESIVGLMGKMSTDPAKQKKSSYYMTPKPVLRRRQVNLGMYLPATPTVLTESSTIVNFSTLYKITDQLISKELSGPHSGEYYVIPTNDTKKRIYVTLMYPEEGLSNNSVNTLGATVFELNGLCLKEETVGGVTSYYASYYVTNNHGDYYLRLNKPVDKFGFAGPGDVQFDNLAIQLQSGVTLAWGYDIGQGTREAYQYNIKFKILVYSQAAQQPSGNTEFKLRYKDRVSSGIKLTATEAEVEKALLDLIGLKANPWAKKGQAIPPKTVTVSKITNSGVPSYPTGWDISIVRINMDPNGDSSKRAAFRDGSGDHGFYNIYSGSVFYHPDKAHESTHANILITPALEKDRYVVNTNSAATSGWSDFTKLLNDLFGGVSWRDPSHFTNATAADIDNFESMLRAAYNIRRGNAFLPVLNHNAFLRKFHLPDIDKLYPRWIKYFYSPRFDKKATKVSANLKNRLSAAEKYVMATIAYSGDLKNNPDVEEAVKEKNLDKLLAVVAARNKQLEHRRNTITKNLNKHFKKALYRNIVED